MAPGEVSLSNALLLSPFGYKRCARTDGQTDGEKIAHRPCRTEGRNIDID